MRSGNEALCRIPGASGPTGASEVVAGTFSPDPSAAFPNNRIPCQLFECGENILSDAQASIGINVSKLFAKSGHDILHDGLLKQVVRLLKLSGHPLCDRRSAGVAAHVFFLVCRCTASRYSDSADGLRLRRATQESEARSARTMVELLTSRTWAIPHDP
jgi:hypothetical protein